jgi:hypothetical protein
MLRTFIDYNGKIQFMPYNNLQTIYNLYNTPVIYKPTYDTLVTSSDIYTDIYNYKLYSLPIITSYNNFFNVNNDPELRKRIYKYFYKKYRDIWLSFSYEKLFKYFIKENDKIIFVKSREEYINNKITDKKEKKEYILKNIFGKHEMLIFLDRFIRKNNLNWYDVKQNNQNDIKSAIYKKIKNHIEKIIMKNF